MDSKFDRAQHDRLIAALAQSSYVRDYIEFCTKYTEQRDVDGRRMNMAAVLKIFDSNGITCKLDKRFKVFQFDGEDVCNWRFIGSLVVQRYDTLEPMMEGESTITGLGVGSTLMIMARDAAKLAGSYDEIRGSLSRPKFDGDMRTMERMVPDLVRLFRSMKDVIRRNWDAEADLTSQRS